MIAAACTTKSIEHGTPGESGFDTALPTATGFGSSGAFGDEEGNYPEPATTRCGDVMGDLPAISNLQSAWAVIAVPDATRGGEDVPAGSVLLRLSEDVISDCGSTPTEDSFGGSSGFFVGSSSTTGGVESTTGPVQDEAGRGLELMLTPDDHAVGTYALGAAADLTTFGGGPSEAPAEATLELLHVDDDCVIGTIRGLTGEDGETFMEGGFVAQTCQRQCIPHDGRAC